MAKYNPHALSLLIISIILVACASATTPTSPPAAPTSAGDFADLGGRDIRIGSDTTFPPFEFVDENQNIVGFEPDLMAKMCELLNCKPIWLSIAFDGIFAGLEEGEYDIIWAAIHITEERDKTFDFSIPYYEVGEVVTVRIDEDRIQSYEDLRAPGIITGVQTGSTSESSALETALVPEAQIKRYQGLDTNYLALVNGDVDAVISGSAAAASYVGVHEGKLRIIGGEGKDAWFTTRGTGIVLQEGDDELRTAFNAAIEQLLADGTIDALLEKWEIGTE